MKITKASSRKIRYAVVGLGDIAQVAVLPGFANARANSKLTALVSDDPLKLKKLAKIYKVNETCGYDEYDAMLRSDKVDAVYLALPNAQHRDFTVRAAQAGIHVLTEKPMAVDEAECQQMIKACAENQVKLMVAYRLHFERANLEAIKILSSGKIGDLRIYQSLFTQQVKPGNVRLKGNAGGGSLYDVGVYCINAARYLFRAEPTEVFAYGARNDDPRFAQIDEMSSAIMTFPKDRLASFTSSFGAASNAIYTVVGTRGTLKMNHGFEYSDNIEMEIKVGERTERRKYSLRDQFGPELVYFSDCILRNREPEPNGIEGLVDIHIIRSLYESARTGLPVRIKQLHNTRRPDMRQEIRRPPAKHPQKLHAQSPSR